jgi:hypothetical protein
MQTINKLFLIITILCLSISPVSAQESTLRLISVSNDTLNLCRIDSLSDIVLFASCSNKALSLPIDSIAIIERIKEGHFLKGAALGTLVGVTVGAIIGYATYQKPEPRPNGLFTIDLGPGPATLGGGLIGGVGGFVVGGVIGSSSDHYTIDLRSRKTLKMKRLIIQQVFVN